MKYISTILFVFTVCICHSCGKQQQTPEAHYPFDETSKIEVLSYSNRFEWDTIVDRRVSLNFGFIKKHEKDLDLDSVNIIHKRSINSIIEGGKLRLDRKNINESIILDKEQKTKLYNILYTPASNNYSSQPCYFPQYAILFYNEKGEAIESFEFSIECQTEYLSEGMDLELCERKYLELRDFLKEIGITYFDRYLDLH